MKFVLPLPPTLNSTYKMTAGSEYNIVGGKVVGTSKSRMYKSKDAGNWEMDAFVTIKEQKPKMIEGRAVIVIKWLLKHDRDIDAGEKIILDILQKARVIQNDDRFYSKLTEKYFDLKNPRVEVYVVPDREKRELYNEILQG